MTINGDCSQVDKTAQLYKNAEVQWSKLAKKVVIGENSRIQKSVISEYVRIDRNNLIQNSSIGRMSYTGNFCVIQEAEIGSFCSISWGVTIGGGEHNIRSITTHDFVYNDRYDLGLPSKKIHNRYALDCKIGHDVWIGANSTVLRGVRVGTGAVIGANSLVSRDVPEYSIVVGNPAHVIKYRFEEPVRARLLQSNWWCMDLEKIKKNLAAFSSEDVENALDILEKN